MGIIRDGVHNEHFFKSFKENFRGSRITRRVHLPFTLVTLWFLSRFKPLSPTGTVRGRVGEVRSPHFSNPSPHCATFKTPPLSWRALTYLSQFRSRRHKCSSLTRGFLCPNIYRWPSYWSVVRFPCRIQSTSSRSLAETMYHVLPTYRGRLFYWHREIADLLFLTDNQVLKPALDYDGCNQWHH